MIINLDKTPSKFVPGLNKTLVEKGRESVPIASSSDKQMIATKFSITLTREFLPIQLIYSGKTRKSIPAVSFPSAFVISANEQRERSFKCV